MQSYHAQITVPNLYLTFPPFRSTFALVPGLPLQVTNASGGVVAMYHLPQNSHWQIYIIAHLVKLIHTSISL